MATKSTHPLGIPIDNILSMVYHTIDLRDIYIIERDQINVELVKSALFY